MPPSRAVGHLILVLVLAGDIMSARRGVPAVLLALLAVLLCAPAASAHTELRDSSPQDGAQLRQLPSRVALTFTTPVEPDEVRVTVGRVRLPVSRPADGRKDSVTARLHKQPEARHGRLTLTWRVIDEQDGHASSGRIGLRVPAGSDTDKGGAAERGHQAAPAPTGPSAAVHRGLVTARWAGYLSLALFVGGLAFVALLWPRGAADRRARALLAASWLCGLLSSVAAWGLQGAYAAMGGLGDVLTPASYRDILDTEVGVVLATRGLLWVLAAVVLAAVLQGGDRAARSPGWRVGAAAVALGLLRTAGMSGHSSEGAAPGWGATADLAHLLGVSLWIGGLAMLAVAVLPRRRPEELAAVVPRYSTLAAVSVTAIAAAGLVLAWQVVGSFGALLHTAYGQLLLLKVAVLLATLLVAQSSRLWVRNRLDIAVLLRGDAASVRPFGYSVAAETGLVLVVLAVTSLLVTSDPGR
ncbi:CopD family protein [Streptomyces sp. NPDC019937]|uniref:copper resistance CopC/CopD family protein n=1 Tax=Streptomyces sp. NPDC019937 TaxID=3154787 RepID=UPI0033E86F82